MYSYSFDFVKRKKMLQNTRKMGFKEVGLFVNRKVRSKYRTDLISDDAIPI